MKIEFKSGSSNIDPWMKSDYPRVIESSDIVTWVRVEDKYTFKVSSDTESRISSGEDPEKVLIDSLERLGYDLFKMRKIHGHIIEIGLGEGKIDAKTKWKFLASGKDYHRDLSSLWIYYDDRPPFQVKDYQRFLEDVMGTEDEEELNFIIELWKLI